MVKKQHNRQKGNNGELIAKDYLINKKYEILKQNYLTKYGEIDIIAKTVEYVVFIEVKMRKNDSFGQPCEAVTQRKINKIINSAKIYISENNLDNCNFRFDIIEVFGNNNINHIENCFWE